MLVKVRIANSVTSISYTRYRTARPGVWVSVVCAAMLSACLRSQRTPSVAILPEVSAPQSATLLEIARGFWRAAAQRDFVTMSLKAVADQPVQWALSMETSQPGYFMCTVDQLRLVHAYH